MPLKIGLTGGIGSGKSTIAQYFEKLGVTVIDADLIAKELTKPGTPIFKSIVQHFGHQILNTDQSLDRKKLRQIIFNHPTEKKWLENQLHPLIFETMKSQSDAVQALYCILVIPLLVETQTQSLAIVHRVLVVDSPLSLQLKRICKRDQISEQAAQLILKYQATSEERKKIADDWIVNDQGPDELEKQVKQLHLLYTQMATQKK